MKTRSFITVLLLAIVSLLQAQSTKTVELPYVAHSNTTSLEIAKVTLTEGNTTLDINAFFRPRAWIRIAADSYLYVDGKKYMIKDGEGIDLDSLFWMPASGEASFKLLFEPIPTNTITFDFIESDCDDCFKIWGINLNNKPTVPNIPNEYLQSNNKESEIISDWKKGKAKVSGQLIGYTPNIEIAPRLVYFNPITAKSESISIMLNDDGTFSTEINMYNTSQVLLTYNAPQTDNFWFIAAPEEETKVMINLPEANRLRTKLKKESSSYGKRMYFSGYEAKLNDELNSSPLLRDIIDNNYHQKFFQDIAGMTMKEYQNYVMNKYEDAIDANNALSISSKAKDIANIELAFKVNNALMSAEGYLIQAYMDANKISREEASKSIMPLKRDESFNDYLKQLPFQSFDKNMLLTQYLTNNIGMLSFVRSTTDNTPFAYFRFLLNSDKVEIEDKETISNFIKENENNESINFDSTVNSILSSYTELQREYFENKTGANYLSQLWNIQDCFLLDLIRSNQLVKDMEDFNPLTDKQKEDIKNLPDIMQEIILKENDILLAKIEENKNKSGYTILEAPEVADSNLFAEIIKPFKGKVVFVDIWATWCGPCISANKSMEPIKEQLSDQDIVYLYLTDESSPLNTWQNMIADLGGYHYRISSISWNHLRDELKSTGVPTYLIIDKEGNQAFHSVGFPGSSKVVNELKKQL